MLLQEPFLYSSIITANITLAWNRKQGVFFGGVNSIPVLGMECWKSCYMKVLQNTRVQSANTRDLKKLPVSKTCSENSVFKSSGIRWWLCPIPLLNFLWANRLVFPELWLKAPSVILLSPQSCSSLWLCPSLAVSQWKPKAFHCERQNPWLSGGFPTTLKPGVSQHAETPKWVVDPAVQALKQGTTRKLLSFCYAGGAHHGTEIGCGAQSLLRK